MEKQKQSICTCNFCGKNQGDLIKSGKSLFKSYDYKSAVCNDCAEILLKGNETPLQIRKRIEDFGKKESKTNLSNLSPCDVYEHILKRVKGQDEAVKAVSLAISNHFKSFEFGFKKTNVLIAGPSGTGKTEMARAIQDLGVPVLIFDATSLTTAGYVGDSVESIITQLLQMTKGDVELAERGVIFIDEIDKKAEKGPNSGEIGTTMVQDALLKIVEGTKLYSSYNKESVVVDTSKILFICAGAFGRVFATDKPKSRVGLNATSGSISPLKSSRELLCNYGLKQEFVRRFPIITFTRPHTVETLVEITVGKGNSYLSNFITKLSVQGISASVDENYIRHKIETIIENPLPLSELEEFFENLIQSILFDKRIQTHRVVKISEQGIEFRKKILRR